MKWNLRMTAASRGIWKASELRRMLAEHGLVISAGKMFGLWSGQPQSVRLSDLDIICQTLDCTPADLLIAEPVAQRGPAPVEEPVQAAVAGAGVVPRRRSGRSLPPA
jgi:DNA-binding Xre family transcriptional regulator